MFLTVSVCVSHSGDFACSRNVFLTHRSRTMVVCYCTVSDIGGTPMMICSYHYRMDIQH